MKYVYAALILHKLKKEITEDSLKAVITAAGGTHDEPQAKSLVSALKDVDIDEALRGMAVAAPLTPPEPKPEPEPEPEKKDEKDDDFGISDLFK